MGSDFVNPNIDEITMTYGYMRTYEIAYAAPATRRIGRAGRALAGRHGAEHPGRLEAGVTAGMKRAVAGAEREQREGASGKWVAHWKMVHIVRPVWEKAGDANQLGRSFPPLTYTNQDAADLRRSNRRRAPCAARVISSAWRCSMATRSARAYRRRH